MKQLAVEIKRIKDEAIDVKSYELVSSDGRPLPVFTPGSHIDVCIEPGLVRQYSLCGPATDTSRYRIAVKKEAASSGGSRAMHEKVKEGDRLAISAPRNNFALAKGAWRHVLVAGGIGITPLLGHALHLLEQNSSFELHYFSRSVAHTAFYEPLSAARFNGKAHFHFGLGPSEVSATLKTQLAHPSPGTHLYLCGPRPFMELAQDITLDAWPADSVHREYFTPDAKALSRPRRSFTIRLARSGGEYEVDADRSIIETLAAHGINVPTSCESGVCGTCLTGVLEGMPDHRDDFLSDSEKREGKQMLLCVSRARTGLLVLDL